MVFFSCQLNTFIIQVFKKSLQISHYFNLFFPSGTSNNFIISLHGLCDEIRCHLKRIVIIFIKNGLSEYSKTEKTLKQSEEHASLRSFLTCIEMKKLFEFHSCRVGLASMLFHKVTQ